MSRQRVQFVLDPAHRTQQLAFLRERVEDIKEVGDQFWGSIAQEEAPSFAERGIIVQFRRGSDVLLLPSVMFRPSAETPQPPADLTAREPAGDERAVFIAQFVARPDTSWLDALSELGADLIDDLPPQAALLRLTAAQAAAARELPFVTWVGLYHPAYALHYPLAGRTEPFNAATLRDLQVNVPLPVSDAGNLQVLPFADVGAEGTRSGVEGAGAIIRDTSGVALIVSIAAAGVRKLLCVPGIRALETYAPLPFF